MKEIGGYFELDSYHLPMLHEGAIALNCGRNALAYLIESKSIHKICLPYFLCSSIQNICAKYKVKIRYYHIDWNFYPEQIELGKDEWFYLVNYYGQLSIEYIKYICDKYRRVIVDNAQNYFALPIKGVDTIYTCRKYFGVADGAFLYSNKMIDKDLPIDESYTRMSFVLGRYEKNASKFYAQSVQNNKFFANEPIKCMSRLTENLLHGIDYELVRSKRISNFMKLHAVLKSMNRLKLHNETADFMYPLLVENGYKLRKKLQEKSIFIPILWPNVTEDMEEDCIEWHMARDILPIPCDQRYDEADMEYILEFIKQLHK